MSAIEETLLANARYAEDFKRGGLAVRPTRKLAIVTCMDSRMDMFEMLGLKLGEAHVIRNAGGIVTDDVLRSLIISHHLLGTEEFMVINHTGCGMLLFEDEQLKRQLELKTGATCDVPPAFLAFPNLEHNVRLQVQKIKNHPWMPKTAPVRGFIYDVTDGRIHEVV
jgi:carbonic anhydrase